MIYGISETIGPPSTARRSDNSVGKTAYFEEGNV